MMTPPIVLARSAVRAVGYGPGSDRIAQTFTDIQHAVQARGGDATVERTMLRKARLSIRFGTLNHCAMDETHPVGAACLDNTAIPEGHKGPLQDRCRPDRCVNRDRPGPSPSGRHSDEPC